tara:strand:- start:2415 stop:3554 length:1140 start_codon:yes stop_codon:yes gene_type:complete
MKKRVMLVFGTRPEAIKMAPLCHKLLGDPNFDVDICITAQHRGMLDQVLDIFDLKPSVDLNIMSSKQDLFDITSRVLIEMRSVYKEYKPDIVLVHGDTTTTLASSLAAFYLGIKVGHVEAGLRTYNLQAPFPEELNRQFTGKIANFHFAPTEKSANNLINERVDGSNIFITGNTVIDALNLALVSIEKDEERLSRINKNLNGLFPFEWQKNKFILITGHRRENFGQGFINICEAIKKSAIENPEVNYIYPVHLNPDVQSPVMKILKGIKNVYLSEPLDYEPFIYLMKNSYLVLTDSGGIQEEAPSLGKPVLVMREVTERPEAIDAGTVKLVGTEPQKIVKNIQDLLDDSELYNSMSNAHNPYGDGHACDRILEILKKKL